MTNYRRNVLGGGSYFFTVNISQRHTRLLTDHVGLLRAAFKYARTRHPFSIDAIVVLPDHLHAIWTLPPGDSDYSLRWRLIKGYFSRAFDLGEHRSKSRIAKGERGIWQRRYWEHTVRDDADFGRHVDYIHINPVKHGHVSRVVDWPHSSFHRFVGLGVYPIDWAGGDRDDEGEFGERGER